MLACLIPLLGALSPVPAAPLLMHSPHDVIVARAISPDFEHDQTLFVSLPRFNLLLRSRDGGGSFEPAGAGLATSYVLGLAISPDFARDRTLWCLEPRGPFVSQDAGESWSPLAVPAGLHEMVALEVSPDFARDGTLAAGSLRDGLWISRDRGASWSRAELAEGAPTRGRVTPLAFSPAFGRDGSLAAVVNGASVVLSADGGHSFTEVAAPQGVAQALVLGGADVGGGEGTDAAGGALWVGTRASGVWRSDDRGATWQPEGTETGSLNVLHLSRAPGPDGGVLFASTAVDGVLVRKDGGSWTGNTTGFREKTHQTSEHYTGTLPSPNFAADRTVFAAAFEGLYVSRNGGDGWQWINVLHPRLVRNIAISRRFAEDQTLWLSSYGAGLLESSDGGATFRTLDSAGWMFPDGIAASPDGDPLRTLLVGTPNRLLISTDGGKTTRPALPGGRGFPRLVAFAPDYAESGLAFAHFVHEDASRDRFVRTADRCATWTDSNVRVVDDLAFAPDWADSRRLWAASPDGLYRSDDAGLTLHRVETLDAQGITSIAVAPGGEAGAGEKVEDGSPGDILMACSRAAGLSCSRDGGQSWSPVPLGRPPVRPYSVRLSPGFAEDGVAFAGPINDELHVTRDGGQSWSRVTGGPRIVLALDVSPTFASDRTLVVGSYDGPWISRDAGASWARLVFDVPAEPAMSHEPAGARPPDAAAPPR